jgi:hypothetical protein
LGTGVVVLAFVLVLAFALAGGLTADRILWILCFQDPVPLFLLLLLFLPLFLLLFLSYRDKVPVFPGATRNAGPRKHAK